MPPKHQAKRRHQHHSADARVGMGRQLRAVGNQHTVGFTGIGVSRPFLAIALQTLQIRLRTGQDQRGLAAGRIADHADLTVVQIGAQQRICPGGSDRRADLQRAPVPVAQGTQPARIKGIVTRVDQGDDHKALAGKACGEVMQRQWAPSIAVGNDQQPDPPLVAA